jgi:chaperonin GroEL
VDDAVAATKAALEEGIVPGGGVTLVNIAQMLLPAGEIGKKIRTKVHEDPTLISGISVLAGALVSPFMLLMENAGLNSAALLDKVQSAKQGQGVDVNNPKKLVDLKSAGIIDPARVTKEAVQNAVSIAGTAITMGALVVEVPEPKTVAPAGGGMDPGMMGM